MAVGRGMGVRVAEAPAVGAGLVAGAAQAANRTASNAQTRCRLDFMDITALDSFRPSRVQRLLGIHTHQLKGDGESSRFASTMIGSPAVRSTA